MKTDLLSSINHEIRTPLSGILGMADLLMETPLDDRQREYVAATRTCAEELLENLNAALEFSALESSTLVPDEEDFNLPEILMSVTAQYEAKARERGLGFSATFDPDLPQVASGDAVRLRQVISHLLSNAIKSTAMGAVAVESRAEPASSGEFLLTIRVLDTGIGIGPRELPSIFTAFRRGDTGVTRRYPGLGLGLALADRLVSLMGGEMRVESSPENGSVLTCSLPLRVPREVSAARRTAAPAKNSWRVLVAEDDAVSTRVLSRMLARGPHQVRAVVSGEAAVAEAAGSRFDAIVMDLQLPGMDGFEATRRIRELPGYAGIPIIALTAHTGEDVRTQCLSRGMQGFLEKPVRAEQLLAILARLLL